MTNTAQQTNSQKKTFVFKAKQGEALYRIEIEAELNPQQHKAKRWDTLEEVEGLPCFSVSGSVYEGRHKQPFTCGQCLETIAKLADFVEESERLTLWAVLHYWRAYHLNELKAGTQKQEALLSAEGIKGKGYDYDKAKKTLEAFGLLEDRGYKYGHGWLIRPISPRALERIKELLSK